VTSEETSGSVGRVNVTHGFYHAEPGPRVFCKLRIRGLEQDLDAVERTYYGLGLQHKQWSILAVRAFMDMGGEESIVQRTPPTLLPGHFAGHSSRTACRSLTGVVLVAVAPETCDRDQWDILPYCLQHVVFGS